MRSIIDDITLHLPTEAKETRIVAAMSGGVDSSVVAALLAAKGYDVVGVTLQLYDQGETLARKGACCAGQDIYDAKMVADKFGIPHYILDYESLFKDEVVENFADSYMRGETPVPCISCNQTVKFRDLVKVARELDAAALATGHYIRSRPIKEGQYQHFMMERPIDEGRDQSYFLFATTQEQLDYLRFPLGGLTKSQTRDLAHYFGLDIAQKPDSQDICFVPDGNYADLILKLRPEAAEKGNIVDINSGQILGEHKGIIHYTIGQRRGLGIATGSPLFVVKLDPEARIVYVGDKENLAISQILLRDINWLGDGDIEEAAKANISIGVRVRSTRPPVDAKLVMVEGEVAVELYAGEEGVAPGQACVFYQDIAPHARVLGGGWIKGTTSTFDVEKKRMSA